MGTTNIATLIDHNFLPMIIKKKWSSEIDVVTVTTSIYKIKLKNIFLKIIKKIEVVLVLRAFRFLLARKLAK